jgi:hypothetical protein
LSSLIGKKKTLTFIPLARLIKYLLGQKQVKGIWERSKGIDGC